VFGKLSMELCSGSANPAFRRHITICSTKGSYGKCIQNFIQNILREIFLVMPRRRWDDNIKIGVMESGLKGFGSDSSGIGYEELADFCGHGNDLACSIKCRKFNYHLSDY
jgi:hypothetical protein